MRANASWHRLPGLARKTLLPVLAASLSAGGVSMAQAPIAEPTWCVGQATTYAGLASAALLELASQDASRGDNDAALGRLCAAYMRRDVQREPLVAGNIANFAGTILFR